MSFKDLSKEVNSAHHKTCNILKRHFQGGSKNKCHINVTSKTNFKAQVKKCEEILQSEGQLILHCVGRAITKGVSLGLSIVKNSGDGFFFEANTSTVEQIDEYQPVCEEEDFIVQKRMTSSLHIRICRKDIHNSFS